MTLKMMAKIGMIIKDKLSTFLCAFGFSSSFPISLSLLSTWIVDGRGLGSAINVTKLNLDHTKLGTMIMANRFAALISKETGEAGDCSLTIPWPKFQSQ